MMFIKMASLGKGMALVGAIGAAASSAGLTLAQDSIDLRTYRKSLTPESRLAYQALDVIPTPRATFLKGRIVDNAGLPIVGATVDAYHWAPGNKVKTDATGAFEVVGTNPNEPTFEPDEKVEFTFSAPGYTPRYIAAQPLGELVAPVVLDKYTVLRGTVRDEKGLPVAKAKVRAVAGPFEGDGVTITEVPYTTTTDAQGNYELFLQGDKYELFILAAQGNSRTPKIVIEPGAAFQQDVTLKSGPTFRARVVNSLTSKPVAGVALKSSSGDFGGVSDSRGLIEVRNLFPGKIEWSVSAPNAGRWWSQEASAPYARKNWEKEFRWQSNYNDLPFEIAANMAPVTIVVEPGVKISGRVVDPDGKPVAGATVGPALTGTGNSLTGDTRYSVLTNAKGEFAELYPASHDREYNLIAHDGDYGQWRKWANVEAAPFKTKPGQVIKDLTLTLVRPVAVSGRVVNAAGQPVAHAEVRAVPTHKRSNRYYDPTVETDAQGRFVLPFVAPGEHRVQVEPFYLSAEEAPSQSTKTVTVEAGKPLEVGTLTQEASRDR
jgi:protocatechuate 3,4-dioxygenase beta subunit